MTDPIGIPSGVHGDTGLGFAQYLRELPPARVLERFSGTALSERKILSSSEIDRIAREFIGREGLNDAFEGLDEDGRRVCALAYLWLPEGLPAAEAAGCGQQVIESFLVYAVRDKDNNLFYRGFEEFLPVLGTQIRDHIRSISSRSVKTLPRWAEPLHVVNDFVLAILLTAQGKVQETKNGQLSKASTATIRKLLHCAKNSFARDFSRIIELFCDYGTERGLLFDQRGTRALNRQALASWLAADPSILYADILAFATNRVRPWHWELASEVFESRSEGEWFALDSLGSAVSGTIADGALLGTALGGLCVLEHDGETLVAARPRVAKSGAASESAAGGDGSVTILADFSVIIHQECPPAVLAAFCEVSELFALDGVYRGSVSRQAVADSLYGGLSAERLLSRLSEWGAPGNVLETVREWVREAQRVSMPEEHVVLVSDPTVGEQIAALEDLKGMLSPTAVACAFRIRPGCELEVRQALIARGFETRAPQVWRQGEQEISAGSGLETECDRDKELVISVDDETVVSRRGGLSAGGKYGAGLKELSPVEMDHVIDYAIIMGHRLRLDYDGSPWVKRGEYTIEPESFTAGTDGVVEGTDIRTGTRKRFIRARIKAIGVIES